MHFALLQAAALGIKNQNSTPHNQGLSAALRLVAKPASEPDVYNFGDRGGACCVEREYHVISWQQVIPVTRKLGSYSIAALGEGESEESLLHVVGVGNGTHPQKRDPADKDPECPW